MQEVLGIVNPAQKGKRNELDSIFEVGVAHKMNQNEQSGVKIVRCAHNLG